MKGEFIKNPFMYISCVQIFMGIMYRFLDTNFVWFCIYHFLAFSSYLFCQNPSHLLSPNFRPRLTSFSYFALFQIFSHQDVSKQCAILNFDHRTLGNDWKRCDMTKIRHSKLFWTTLVGKDWEKCEITKIWHSKSFWTTLVGKDGEKCRITKLSLNLAWTQPELSLNLTWTELNLNSISIGTEFTC